MRYSKSEMTLRDSMKVENGGIIPDVFVPMDTTKVSQFYMKCTKKASTLRFASDYFDHHRGELSAISDYSQLLAYLDNAHLDTQFLSFVKRVDGLSPEKGEWDSSKDYMMTQIKALVGRYSQLGDNAFYHLYLSIDDTFKAAIEQ